MSGKLEQRRAALSPELRRRLAERMSGRKPREARDGNGPSGQTISRFAGEAAPLSFAQRRLWFLDQLDPGSPHYNVPGAVSLRGELKVSALSVALHATVERHESLRTVFLPPADGTDDEAEPRQIIRPATKRELPRIDLGGLPPARRQTEADHLAVELARWRFDLKTGPLLISALIRLEATHHLLLLVQHHIVSDGWSVDLLVRDLTSFYRAACSGGALPDNAVALPPLPIRYQDFAAWQRQTLVPASNPALNTWRQKLEGAPLLLELPLDHPRPRHRAMRGHRLGFELTAERTAALRGLAQNEHTTLFTVLLTTWTALLSRFTGQQDLLIGSPVAGRQRPELRDLIGFFVNTLVLRGDLRGRPTFRALLARLRQNVVEGLAHQDLPFETLVEALSPERDTSHTPIFQVLFALREQPPSATLEGLEISLPPIETRSAKFDLTAEWQDLGTNLRGELEFDLDLFEPATAERLVRCYQTLIRAVLAEPDAEVAALNLLDDVEQRQLRAFSHGDPDSVSEDIPLDSTLDHLFSRIAAEHPERVALTDSENTLTFGEVSRRSQRIAQHLQRIGIGEESAVGVMIERRVEWVQAILGVLQAGAFYVPIDPALPLARRRTMVEDTSMSALLTLGEGGDLEGVIEISLDRHVDMEAEHGIWVPLPDRTDRLAYTLFTSGSTGRPKGVMVAHRGLLHLVAWHHRTFALQSRDRASLVAGLGFDVASWELWANLTAGVSLHLPREATRLDPIALRAWLRDERISLAFLPTAVVETLLQEPWPADSPLRALMTAGDRLHGGLDARRPPLFNLYGPTETSVLASGGEVGEDTEPTIGRPLGRLRVRLLDSRLRPVPVGVVGELTVGGVALARGYLGRPARTAEVFVPDPLADQPGERLYRTGDLARWRADGELMFLGRFDHQIKIRGYRIELGEIEAALAEHPEVEQAVVLTRNETSGPQLVAFLATSSEQDLRSALRDRLRQSLPDYMVPARFAQVTNWPLNANGKVDRQSLLDREWPEAESETLFVAPQNPIEESLADIWCQVLGRERVGIFDSFFDLGGHSLLATRVIAAAQQVFGIAVPVRQVFEHPTIATFARHLKNQLSAAPSGDHETIVPVPHHGDLPLSPFQERLWFLDQFDRASATLNIPVGLELEGELDLTLLRQAVARIVDRHEALRTTFHSLQGKAVARVGEPFRVDLPEIDLSLLASDDRDAIVARLNQSESLRPFDLEKGPLLRLQILRLTPRSHVVLVNLHHIISDGWSMQVFARELGEHYRALVEERDGQSQERRPASEMPPLSIQYADFVDWQRRWLDGEARQHQLDFWLRVFETLPAPLELPLDRPRPAVLTYRGARTQRVLSPEITTDLRQLGRDHGATLFMTLLAGVEVLLSRLSGQTDLVIGAPIAGRQRAEVADLIGYFANNLALRTDLSGRPSFVELLARVRRTAFDAYAHQELPFEHLLEVLKPERELSHTPLFQVFFNMLDADWDRLDLPGLQIGFIDLPEPPSKFDLVFYVKPSPRGLILDLVYNADLFDPQRIAFMLEQLEALYRQILERPTAQIDEYSLLTPSMRAAVPDPRVALDETWMGSVFERFSALATASPDRPAVIEGEQIWTYEELLNVSRRLAHFLQARGLGREDVVAIWCDRSARLVASLLGVLGSGAQFVVIDPAHPMKRLHHIVRLTQPAAWIELATESADLLELFDASPEDCLRLSFRADEELLPEEPSIAPAVEIGPDDGAYLAFTSGTTGVPKGIRGRHGSLTHFMPWMVERFDFAPEDRFAMLGALSHDPLHRDVFTPLQVGASILVPDDERLGEPGWLATWMAREGVTIAHLTPSMAQMITSEAPEGIAAPKLRHVYFLGEALKWRDLVGVWSLAPNASCCNLYGATETQRASAFFDLGPEELERRQGQRVHEILPVGRGMRDIQILILNGDRQAGIGEIGELCFRSPHIALGYLDNPELNAVRFGSNPYSDDPDDRLYRTGDLGRYLLDGDAFFHGRADRQIKIRGFRVELGEIESVLSLFPGLLASAVEDWTVDGETRLAGYLVPETSSQSTDEISFEVDELRAWLADQLPAYMVPTAFVVLDTLPLKANSELDRPALPEPDWSSRALSGEYTAPRNAIEETLCDIWSEVLGIDQVGIHDPFFHLGGHSLLATQVVARVREALDVDLPLRDLFETPTIAELAPGLALGAKSALPKRIEPLSRIREQDLELSVAQQRLWFLDQLGPGNPANNVPTVLDISGDLDLNVLRRSLAELVRRHETLHTVFKTVDGQPRQRVREPFAPIAPLIDLSALSPADQESEREQRGGERLLQPFDLEEGPLLRATVVRLGSSRHVLLLVLHHIVFDGWSLAVLMQDLGTLYRAFALDEPSPLPELDIQYADFAHWQNRWLDSETVRSQLDYWLGRLADPPTALELPTDRPRPPYQTFRGGLCKVEIPAALTTSLSALAQQHRASLFMVLLAAFQTVLMRHTEQHDLILGSPVAGRNLAQTEPLIGMFFNLLALRGDLSGDPTFTEFLERSREVALGAFSHQDLPFERLLDELQPERHLNRAPLFQVTLVLQNAPIRALELPGLTVTPQAPNLTAAHFDLNLQLVENHGRISGSLAYKEDLFDATTIERLGQHLSTLLEAIAERPDLKLWDLPLLSAAEHHQLAIEWNDTEAREQRPGTTLASIVEAQVERTPNAIAVLFEGQTWTYAEIDRQANQLAHVLRGQGVSLGTLVGVHLGRSAAMIPAVLAVLKAGGAYLPIETSLPAERIHWLIDSLQLESVLTQTSQLDILASLPSMPSLANVVCLDELGQDAIGQDAIGQDEAEQDVTHPFVESSISVIGRETWERASATPLEALAGPGDLAYIIFTSGSTGRPKGVSVRHEPAVRLVDWVLQDFGFSARDRVLFITSLSFDLSVFDIFGLLAVGGSIRVASSAELEDPRALVEALRTEPITFWDSAPAALRQLVPCFPAAGDLSADDHHLRMVFLSGDWIPLPLPDQVRTAFPGTAVTSLGGATEATVWSNFHRVDDVLPHWLSIPYGRPMENARYHVLDDRFRPCPIGVEGNLYIGGHCLSSGYFHAERLTAERYLPDPFAEEPGARLYATGDRVRAWRDGTLEFLGRRDFQVKIRGFRIELGEIETALTEHPGVGDAVVLARTPENREASSQPQLDRRLVAYVVPDKSQLAERARRLAAAEKTAETIEQWETVYDGIYGQNPEPVDPTFNIVGWNSSYNGQPLAEEEMREWLDRTVDEILALRPRRVLEIGCGTGMLLYAIAPHCEVYHASDLSQVSLDGIARHLESLGPDFAHVELMHRAADDWSDLEIGAYDAVILNSVSQHFPSADYLFSVMEGASRIVQDGGFVFVGDIRNFDLLEAFHASIAFYQAADGLQLKQLAQRCIQRVMQEEELSIAPGFWDVLPRDLPRCQAAETRLKRGRYQNEMTRFRYSAVLWIGEEERDPTPVSWQEGSELALADLHQHLEAAEPDAVIGFVGLANARLARPIEALKRLASPGEQTVSSLRDKLPLACRDYGLDPEELWSLAEACDRHLVLTWSKEGDAGSFDALFLPKDSPSLRISDALDDRPDSRSWREFANDPGLGVQIRALVSHLREHLQERLPHYMMPSAFLLLDALPVSANGKLDRRALPAPETQRAAPREAPTVPRDRTEDVLCEVIARVLGLEQVGIHENFFELGGDSISSIQAVARARELGLEISPRQLFQYQTIAELASVAEWIGEQARVDEMLAGELPLTPIQHWFFEQEQADIDHWNLAMLFALRQDLDPSLLRRALVFLISHHDALRLRFEPGSEPLRKQAYAAWSDAETPFTTLDLGDLAPEDRRDAFDRLAAQTQGSLNLAAGPVLRLALVRWSKDQPARLLIVVHHLVIDGVSWRIFLGDLQNVYGQLAGGDEPALPPKTTSYREWAERCAGLAQSEELEAELPFWLEQADHVDDDFPLDFTDDSGDNTANSEGSARLVSLSLDADDTRFLLQEMPEIHRAQIQEVLLTAVALGFERWRGQHGLRLELEGHGREALFEGVDLSRTLGWFTAIYPVVLDPGSDDPALALANIKEQLRAVPRKGVGFGLLRYLGRPEIAEPLRALPQAKVIFNYLGQFDQVVDDSGLLSAADESPGKIRSARAHRLHEIEIYAWIHNSELRVDFEYSENRHRHSTIDALAAGFVAALHELIEQARESDGGALSPSDFPEADLSQEDLDSLISQFT